MSTETAFDRAFDITVGLEGGYTDDVADPGKATKYGISQAAYPTLDIKDLTLAQAKAIYLKDYWTPLSLDSLPRPLALLTFDAAINNGDDTTDGRPRAAEWLQAAVGAKVDGMLGPLTIAATKLSYATNPTAAASEMMAQRMLFMAGLPTWKDFGRGWSRRLAALPYLVQV
jgi:lysozyme family protein